MVSILTEEEVKIAKTQFRGWLFPHITAEVQRLPGSHEELRARLESARSALREIADYVPTVRSGDAGAMARIAREALGAADGVRAGIETV